MSYGRRAGRERERGRRKHGIQYIYIYMQNQKGKAQMHGNSDLSKKEKRKKKEERRKKKKVWSIMCCGSASLNIGPISSPKSFSISGVKELYNLTDRKQKQWP
jgi:hypothetical protein